MDTFDKITLSIIILIAIVVIFQIGVFSGIYFAVDIIMENYILTEK